MQQEAAWMAIRTRSQCEGRVETLLRQRSVEAYLPSYQMRRKWSDRVKVVDQPLLTGYLLAKVGTQRVAVLSAPGVVQIVGVVTEEEVRALRRLAESGLPASPCPYLKEGARVRVRRGPLEGVEGILQKIKSRYRFVVSVSLLQRSVSVELDPEEVEAR